MYKVGDKVTIKENLKVGTMYGKEMFTDSMTQYLGKSAVVKGYFSCGAYDLDGCGSWHFTDDMLEMEEKKVEIPFDVFTLYKTRGEEMCVILSQGKTNIFYAKEQIGKFTGRMCQNSVDGSGKHVVGYLPEFDIITYKKYSSQSEAIGALLADKEPIWDWREPQETIMTVAEIEKKLGITGLKIVK
jgi:hypothetical protein